MRSYLNVASLVTKLYSLNYYRSENQNTGVKALYATMVMRNHFKFILIGFLRGFFKAINQRYCAKFLFHREKIRVRVSAEKLNNWLGIWVNTPIINMSNFVRQSIKFSKNQIYQILSIFINFYQIWFDECLKNGPTR